MTPLGGQRLRTKICLLRVYSNCKAIAECDPYRLILQHWGNRLLNSTTFSFHLMLFLAPDKVLSRWCTLSSFISNNWRSIKYVIEKAWSCSQPGVGELYGWLMCEQNIAPGTSRLWAETCKLLFSHSDLYRTVFFSCSWDSMYMYVLILPVGCQPLTQHSIERKSHQSADIDLTIWKCYLLALGLSSSSFLSTFVRQLTSYRQVCKVQPLVVESGLEILLLSNCWKCQAGSFNSSTPYLSRLGLVFL